jgi:TPR repeat protein
MHLASLTSRRNIFVALLLNPLGNARAGTKYSVGRSSRADATNIMKQLLLAAQSGNAAAQFNLGVLCESDVDDNGHFIAGSRREAAKWLLAAAEQGPPVLKINLPRYMPTA